MQKSPECPVELNQILDPAAPVQMAIAADTLEVEQIKRLLGAAVTGTDQDIGILEIVVIDAAPVQRAKKSR